ncbi:MAG: extracellular solute-binding protein [Hungatella sp.]
MKKLLALLLVSTMLFCCAGCAAPASSSSAPSQADTAKTESKTEESKVESTAEMAKEIDFYAAILKEEGCTEAVKGFTEKTGIKVNVHSYDSADFVQAFMVASNGGSPVDVMLLNGQDVRAFTKNGLLQDVSKLPAVARLTDAAINQYTLNGKLYGIGAKGGNSSGVYVNLDVLKKYQVEPPKTMQDMIDINNKLKADGLSFFGFGGGNKYMWPMWYFSAFAQTSDDKPIERTEEILTGKAKFTDPDSIEAFKVIETLAKENMFQPGFNGTDSDGGKAIFVNGQSAAYYGGTWEISGLRDAGMENIELIPFPIVKEGAKSIQTGNASDGAYTIYSKIDPARQSAAEAFIDYMASDETVTSFRTSESADLRDYSRVNCNKNVPIADPSDPLNLAHMEFLETMTFTHLDWIYPPEITSELQDTLQALTGLQITPEDAGKQMQVVMDKLLADGYDYNAVTQMKK